MLRIFVLCSVLITAYADQLAWLSKADAEKIIETLKDQHEIALYCSQCAAEPIIVYEVQAVTMQPIEGESYFRVVMQARVSRSSVQAVDATALNDNPQVSLTAIGIKGGFAEIQVDWAYAYIANQEGTFEVVGKKAGLACDVVVPSFSVVQES